MADSVAEAVRSYRERVRAEFEAAFAEDHTPHEVGASFGIGVFLTAFPTLGLGLVAFAVLVAVFDRISKVAIFASVAVLNRHSSPSSISGATGSAIGSSERGRSSSSTAASPRRLTPRFGFWWATSCSPPSSRRSATSAFAG